MVLHCTFDYHMTCLLRNLYAGQEATVRTGHGTTDWFQIGKGIHQGCILSPCLFNFYAEYIMRNAWLEEAQPRQQIKKQRHYFVNKGPSNQGYNFSSGHVWMWELAYKESWVQKNWCFWTVVLEKTLESPLDCKKIQPVHPEGDQSWVFIGRTDVEAETPVLWPPDVKSWLIGKDPDTGKDWRQEEKGTTEDEMVGFHHRLDGHAFGWTLGVGDGQGGLACCSPWRRRVRHDWATELN